MLVFEVGSAVVTELINTINNTFWQDTFSAFKSFSNNVQLKTKEEFKSSSFLYNEKIKMGGKYITNKSFIQIGITYISHLKRNETFLTYQEFKAKFPRVNINCLTFYGIVNAVKQYGNKLSLNHERKSLTMQPHLQKIFKNSKGAAHIYKEFIKKKVPIRGLKTWEKFLNKPLIKNKIFENLQRNIKDTKLKWLQYRILHNILTTNKSVAKYDLDKSEKCSFCEKYPESIEHLFWKCKHIRKLWSKLEHFLTEKCPHIINLKFDQALVLINFIHVPELQTDSVLDLIILVVKQFIYRCKFNKTKPTINFLKFELYRRYEIEKEMALSAGKMNVFKFRWGPYLNLFKSLIIQPDI